MTTVEESCRVQQPSKEAAISALEKIMDGVTSGEENRMVDAAREIRRLTKNSSKNRRHLSKTIEPLVLMLENGSVACNESALIALLNLAVRDERNKTKIVNSGALLPLTGYLCSTNTTLQECATATLLTLTASKSKKEIITDFGMIPILVNILRDGSLQSKIDALLALYNLFPLGHNLSTILSLRPVASIVSLLNSCKKSSKHVEISISLLESLLGFEDGRVALAEKEGGLLTVVEVLEEGSSKSKEHALGALLTICESEEQERENYREAILEEGVIPGLLELTVQGSPESQVKARRLLEILRGAPSQRTQLHADTLDNIVTNIVSKIDGDNEEEKMEKSKKMMEEMVKISMEQSLTHLQQRASVV